MIQIPNKDKRYVQTNRSNVFGNLWSSWNMELDENPGAVRVGKRMKLITKGTDFVSGFGVPVAFRSFDTKVFAIAGTTLYVNGGYNLTSAFTADGSSGATTAYVSTSDMTIYNNTLVTCASDNVYSKVANASGTGAWTLRESGSGNEFRKMAYLKKFDRLYIAGSLSIYSTDASWTFSTVVADGYFLSLSASGVFTHSGIISTIVASDDTIWGGTYHTGTSVDSLNLQCSIFTWDGFQAQITREYKIDATGIYAMAIKDNLPYAMDSNGILRKFTGYAFEEIGRLPLRKEQFLGDPSATSPTSRFIHPNGMVVTENNTVLCLVVNKNLYLDGSSTTVNENLPSGIWEWSKETGFVHKASLSYMPVGTTTVTDYGQNIVSKVGALTKMKLNSTAAQGTYIAGAEYYTNASSTDQAIFTDEPFPTDSPQRYGYFVTTWAESENARDTWHSLYLRYRQFIGSSDKIVAKFRTNETSPVMVSLTWASTTSFTTTTDVSAYTGYEVEILQGTGSGKCAHISSVSYSAPNYTVNLDETFTGASGTAKARIQNWSKIGFIQNQTTDITDLPVMTTASRIQFKVCMEFTGDTEFHGLTITNVAHQKFI